MFGRGDAVAFPQRSDLTSQRPLHQDEVAPAKPRVLVSKPDNALRTDDIVGARSNTTVPFCSQQYTETRFWMAQQTGWSAGSTSAARDAASALVRSRSVSPSNGVAHAHASPTPSPSPLGTTVSAQPSRRQARAADTAQRLEQLSTQLLASEAARTSAASAAVVRTHDALARTAARSQTPDNVGTRTLLGSAPLNAHGLLRRDAPRNTLDVSDIEGAHPGKPFQGSGSAPLVARSHPHQSYYSAATAAESDAAAAAAAAAHGQRAAQANAHAHAHAALAADDVGSAAEAAILGMETGALRAVLPGAAEKVARQRNSASSQWAVATAAMRAEERSTMAASFDTTMARSRVSSLEQPLRTVDANLSTQIAHQTEARLRAAVHPVSPTKGLNGTATRTLGGGTASSASGASAAGVDVSQLHTLAASLSIMDGAPSRARAGHADDAEAQRHVSPMPAHLTTAARANRYTQAERELGRSLRSGLGVLVSPLPHGRSSS